MSTQLFPRATFAPRALAGPSRALEPTGSAAQPATSRLALAAALCALVGFLDGAGFCAAVILGHLSLVRIHRSGGSLRGRRIALLALAVGWIPILAVAAVFVLMFLIGLDVTVHGS